MLKTLVLVVAIFTAQSLIHVNKFSRNVMDPKSCQNFAKPTQKTPEPSKVEPKRSINLANLVQLVLMGAGAPGLGEFDRIDPETGKMFFKLEANNFINSKGEDLQTKAKYFNDGYVESRDEIQAPGFWRNLFSGGRLQSEWEESLKKNS